MSLLTTVPNRRSSLARVSGTYGATAGLLTTGSFIGLLGLGGYLLYKKQVWWGAAALLGAFVVPGVIASYMIAGAIGEAMIDSKKSSTSTSTTTTPPK